MAFRIKISLAGLIALWAFAPAMAGTSPMTGPPAPQYPGQFDPWGDGNSQGAIYSVNPSRGGANDREATIAPGDSLFIDPTGGNFGSAIGPCRYVTNTHTDNKIIVVPLDDPNEYLYYRGGNPAGQIPPYSTQAVCCRPQAITLCSAATGGPQSAEITGAGMNGYGQWNSQGMATATCPNPPDTSYVETETFVCQQAGSGPSADGQWSTPQSDVLTCQPNDRVVYGGCSATCGGGNLYETVYNSCGQITSQGYSGPSCNMQSCCTPNWVTSCGGCDQSSGEKTCTTYDANNCPASGSSSTHQACTYVSNEYVGGSSCTPSILDSYWVGGDCLYVYWDCGSYPNTWSVYGQTSGPGISCSPQYLSENYTCTCITTPPETCPSGQILSFQGSVCTFTGWR